MGFSKGGDEDARRRPDNFLRYITAQDLKQFGLIPELIGRLPVVTHLNPLDRETLRLILTEPKNSIVKQYKRLFEMENIKLHFDRRRPGVYRRQSLRIQASVPAASAPSAKPS